MWFTEVRKHFAIISTMAKIAPLEISVFLHMRMQVIVSLEMLCMFKHDEHFQDDGETDEDESEDDEDDTDNVDENHENYDPNLVQISVLEPSIKKVEEAMAKVSELLKKSDQLICDKCDFIARNANGLNMHKKAKHATIL